MYCNVTHYRASCRVEVLLLHASRAGVRSGLIFGLTRAFGQVQIVFEAHGSSLGRYRVEDACVVKILNYSVQPARTIDYSKLFRMRDLGPHRRVHHFRQVSTGSKQGRSDKQTRIPLFFCMVQAFSVLLRTAPRQGRPSPTCATKLLVACLQHK